MNFIKTIYLLCLTTTLLAVQPHAAAQNSFTDADFDGIKTFLHDSFHQTKACIVIGLADERGSRIFSAGILDDGTDQRPDGDTLFFIGSVSKTFTALLLQDAVERGEMKLEDSVAKYLPKSVRMPSHDGKEITLLDLATHTAGFPGNPDNMSGATVKQQYETYTVEKMYAFLSSYRLSRDPGTEFEYSNVGMALLGHVIALNAGTNFEALVVNRICHPLHMHSTCITLTPEQNLSVGLVVQKIGNVSTAGKSVAECQSLLRANGSPKVHLELVDSEGKGTKIVEVTRGKFVTSG
jgi:D-alanyl-D-alanine-carboxypeptidase/D-alanyl-D-alanine-endopeptidase